MKKITQNFYDNELKAMAENPSKKGKRNWEKNTVLSSVFERG